jgi:hypothetical protein
MDVILNKQKHSDLITHTQSSDLITHKIQRSHTMHSNCSIQIADGTHHPVKALYLYQQDRSEKSGLREVSAAKKVWAPFWMDRAC